MSNFMGPMAPPPAAPAQPQALDFQTDPNQRQRFKQFMRQRMQPPMPQMPAPMPMAPAAQPMPYMGNNIDIFAPQPMAFAQGGSVSDALADALSNDIGDYSADDTMTDLSQTSYNDFDPGGNESFDAAAMDQFRNQQRSDISDTIGQQIQSAISSNQQMGTPAPVPQSTIEQMQFENLQNVPTTEPVFSAPSLNLGGQSASFDLLGNPLTIGFEDGGSVPPRRTEIGGNDHMLSYITPDEADILQALGGSGEAGPMGIPSFNPNEDRANEEAAADDEMGDIDTMSGPSNSSSSSSSSNTSNDRGRDSYDADTGIDAETSDNYTPGVDVSDTYQAGVGTGFGSYKGYNDIEGGGQNPDRASVSYGDESAALRDQRLFGGERGLAGYTQAQMQELEARDTALSRAIQDRLKNGVYDIITDNKGNIMGVTSPAKGVMGSLGRGLGSIMDKVMGTGGQRLGDKAYQPSDLFDAVYTGRNDYDPFSKDDDSDGGDDSQKESAIKSVIEEIKPIVTSTDAYYGRGVGAGTLDMADPANIAKYLLQVGGQGVGGQTPSPIGATYDPIKKTYTMPDGTVIDAVTGRKKKLSGLEIFQAT